MATKAQLLEENKTLFIYLKSAFEMIHNADMMHLIEHDTSDMCNIPWCNGARKIIESS